MTSGTRGVPDGLRTPLDLTYVDEGESTGPEYPYQAVGSLVVDPETNVDIEAGIATDGEHAWAIQRFPDGGTNELFWDGESVHERVQVPPEPRRYRDVHVLL